MASNTVTVTIDARPAIDAIAEAQELIRSHASLRAEVEALKARIATRCDFARLLIQKDAMLDIAQGSLDEALAEVEALRADAQRYRWLKDHSTYTTVTPRIHGDAIGPSRMRWYHDSHQLHAFTLDAAIDAARAAQGGET